MVRGIDSLLLLCVLLVAVGASARTITVAKDGSGEYGVIQEAVNASAPGDTILIRAGEYTEHAPYTDAWGGTWDSYVAVHVDDLTFRGTDRDSVVIGPESPDFVGFEPKGFLGDDGIFFRVENVTVRNVRDGFNVPYGASMENVTVTGCYIGALMRALTGGEIANCSFSGGEVGALLVAGTTGYRIVGSTFEGMRRAIDLSGNMSTVIQDCWIEDVERGIQFEQFSSGSISSTVLVDVMTTGVRAIDGAQLQMERVTIGPATITLRIEGGSHVSISRCSIGLGSSHTIALISGATGVIQDCDLAVSGTESVWFLPGSYIFDPPKIVDMRNNYWGLPDSASIADVIWDMNDDPEIKGIVEFMPFSTTPLPTEQKSMGSFKALFGGR